MSRRYWHIEHEWTFLGIFGAKQAKSTSDLRETLYRKRFYVLFIPIFSAVSEDRF